MLLGEVNAALSLWDRISRWWRGRKYLPAESIATRFVRLFESHCVHRNQIPSFIGHGLTLQDIQDDTSLLAKLDETLLEFVCERFAVRRGWLDGAESEIYPCHDFYKHPEEFAAFLGNLKDNNPDGDLHGTLLAPKECYRCTNTLLILQETVGFVGDNPIHRYYLCNNWDFAYWKSRAYLTACVAIACKHQVYIHGIYMPGKEIERLAEGETLMGWQGDGITSLGYKRWYPEDMALRPEVFIQGVDPERENFGITAGLRLWLDLDEQGYMDTGIEGDARRLFQDELSKYAPLGH